jgi:hypothetical protein
MQSVSQDRVRPVNAISSQWRLARRLALAMCVSASVLVATAAPAAASTYPVTDLRERRR